MISGLPASVGFRMCYPKQAEAGGFTRCRNVSDYPSKCHRNIKQEVIDCLIASRSAYEINREEAEWVLKRSNYELDASRFDLLLRTESPSIAPLRGHQNFVMVRSSAGYIIVACRGTFSLSDLVADVMVAKLPVEYAKGQAQIGFLERAMTMPLELFVSLLRAGENLIFTGHSLGGAVSSLAALRVLEAIAAVPGHVPIAHEQVRCITFGTAPFANLELAAYVNSRYKSNFHHVVSKHDVIPRAHNLLPRFFFPVARWLVDRMRASWELRACGHMIEAVSKLSVDKAMIKLEEKLPLLWPATWFYRFLKECAAYDEEALFYGHVGYLLLLDPDTDDPESAIVLDEMERLGSDFGVEDKTASEIYYEHGLGNHYSCLVKGLGFGTTWAANCASADLLAITAGGATGIGRRQSSPLLTHKNFSIAGCAQLSELMRTTTATDPPSAGTATACVRGALSMRQLLRNPLRPCLVRLNNYLLRLTGNEFPCSKPVR